MWGEVAVVQDRLRVPMQCKEGFHMEGSPVRDVRSASRERKEGLHDKCLSLNTVAQAVSTGNPYQGTSAM